MLQIAKVPAVRGMVGVLLRILITVTVFDVANLNDASNHKDAGCPKLSFTGATGRGGGGLQPADSRVHDHGRALSFALPGKDLISSAQQD